MDPSRIPWYRMAFENQFLKAKRHAFQDFFADLMEQAHPNDFQRIRLSRGDHGCDGYLCRTKTVFQVYAPREIHPGDLHRKITADFEKAKDYFQDKMAQWVFVHNDPDGFTTETVMLIKNLETGNSGITTGSWGFEELWRELERLPQHALDELLRPWPAEQIIPPEGIPSAASAASHTAGTLQTEAILGADIVPVDDASSQCRILSEQVDAQTEAIRQYLDKHGQQFWDEIKRHMANMSFPKAIAAGNELEVWLRNKGAKASPFVRGQAYVLLADLAIIKALDSVELDGVLTTQARAYYDQSREAFGADISAEDAQRLISLKAKLDAVDGDYAKAFESTEGIDSPGVISLRIALLIEQGDWERASAILRDRPLHERWCDSAVIVYVENAEDERAKEVIDWAKSKDTVLYHRCLLSFARTVAAQVQNALQMRGCMLPGQLTDDEQERLTRALSALHPVLCGPEGTRQCVTGLEAESLALAVAISHLLSEHDSCRKYCQILGDCEPVHLAFARAVQAGVVDSPDDLPERLRRDHASRPGALMIAASIEGILLGKTREAVAAMRSLIAQTRSAEFREKACELLGELSASLDPDGQSETDRFLSEQLGETHRLVRMRYAGKLIGEDKISEADEVLECIRDENDPVWWQLTAKLYRTQDNKSEAAEAQFRACCLLSRIEVARTAAALAEEAHRWDLLEDVLNRILALTPDDNRARFRLGTLYIDKEDYAEAAKCFEYLWKQCPDEVAFGLNLATCIRNDGRKEESLAVLEPLCHKKPPILQAILSRAQILRECGHPDKAFQSVQPFRGDFWDNEDYLLAYVGLGYSAGRDDVAHEAFARLLELKREEKVSPKKVWSVSVEEAVELFKKQDQTLRVANQALLRGELPWLLVDQARRFPPYLGWRSRTQQLNVSDDPLARATFAVYATNRFTVHASRKSQPRLEEIRCPRPGSDIIIDLSALITLHRLDLLDCAVDYFGTINVPSVYIPTLADDTLALAPHQPSITKALDSITQALDAGRLRVISEDAAPAQWELPVVDEYCSERQDDPPCYHLIDLFSWLHSSGRLSQTEYRRVQQVTHKAARDDLPALEARAKAGIITDQDTLKTICDVDLLDVVLEAMTVHILEEDVVRIRSELRASAAREEVLAWHRDLTGMLNDESRFRRVGIPSSQIDWGPEDDPQHDRTFAALRIALDRPLSLFADDRVCQAAVLNSRRQDSTAAFGTDAFLAALMGESRVSVSDAASHFHQLMMWRYRFLIPPVGVLTYLAREYSARPPGSPLVEVAQYMHDCMRDPGLFAGPEPTEPPIPLAFHLWHAWLAVIAKFVMELWSDPQADTELAEAVTRWSVLECLPVPPSNLHAFVRQNAAESLHRMFLGNMLTRTIPARNEELANRAVLAVKESLGMSDSEYLRLIGDISNVQLES